MRKTFRVVVFAAALVAASEAARAGQTELTGAVQLEAGTSAACVITSAGGLKCWGQGYVGDGSTGRSIAGDVQGLTSGVVAVGLSKGDFIQQGHICAVLASGGVKCWGNNSYGQLGDGTTTTRSTPVDVISLPGPAVAVALGQSHTCALLASGGVHCWGDNSSGQLGGNALTSGIVAIAAAANHSCALTSGGAVKCWGLNTHGQLGDGTTTGRTAPVDVQSLGSGVTKVSGGGGILATSESGSHTCAVTNSGGAKCWGGIRLGDSPGPHLTPFDVPGLTSGVADLSSGGIQTCWGYRCLSYASLTLNCVVTAVSGAKCWGVSWYGSLGNGQTGGDPFYGPDYSGFATDVVGLGNGVTSVAAGGLFGCALVAGGAVRCWGKGYEANGAGYPQPVMQGTLSQYILFGWYGPIPVGGMLTIQATGGPSGNPVVLSSQTPSICSVSGNQVTGLAQGFCVVAANQAGNANYDPAPEVTIRFRVGDPLAQTITFGPPPDVVVNGVGTLSATASSGLPVSFASNTPGICSVSGPIVTGLAQGSCTVAASQAGDDDYAPAPQTTQTFPVGPNAGTSGLRLTFGGSGVGTVTSSPAGISCSTTCGGNFPTGSAVTLTAATGADSYFDRWAGACSGTAPTCTVSLSSAQDVSVYFQSSIPRLANISTRTRVLTGADVMIAGFIIQGNGPKTVVVRARGLSLAQMGVSGVLENPFLQLFSGATQIAFNDNHVTSPNAALIAASGFAPSQEHEAAILMRLDPGAYTAIVSGAGGGTGVALIEVFEVDAVTVPLVNISTRGRVETGDNVMIAGFIIQGTGPQTVVVRARGPSLTAQGVPNVLANPTLSLYSGQTVIASNDDWQAASNAGTIQSSGFAPLDPSESAIYITLDPGAYTAIVQGVGGTSGVGLVEVFRVP